MVFSNIFNGTVPAAWANLSRLESLALDSNALSGPFPAFLLALPGLTALNASNNSFSGPLPQSAGAITVTCVFSACICCEQIQRCLHHLCMLGKCC